MSRARLWSPVLGFALLLGAEPVTAQWYSPQSDKLLELSWNAERLGPSRVLILGDVQNLGDQPASRVILRAEGLDQNGKVVSRGRGFVPQQIPPRGSSAFEIRLVPAGVEKQYRVTVESFEFLEPARDAPQGS